MNLSTITRTARTLDCPKRLPCVYMAGKIGLNDWRHTLVPGLRNHEWGKEPITVCGWVYVGPFFVSCDHGCLHTANSHGVLDLNRPAVCEGPFSQFNRANQHSLVAQACLDAIEEADLVFCYVESLDCFGTLFELGFAHAQGVPIVIALAPGLATALDNDLWFACTRASWVIYNVEASDLRSYLGQAIRRFAWR
jgi:hypothetical protein